MKKTEENLSNAIFSGMELNPMLQPNGTTCNITFTAVVETTTKLDTRITVSHQSDRISQFQIPAALSMLRVADIISFTGVMSK